MKMSDFAGSSPSSEEKSVRIRVGHSPDPDDSFMFYALARGKIPTGPYRFEHALVDIETLNRRALAGELELTALSLHAYAYLADRYLLCTCGASMGDDYGPMVVTATPRKLDELRDQPIAVPGTLTTAYLTLRLCLGRDFSAVVVPFDQILDAVAAGEYQGQSVAAGLVIHEGQLTYGQQGLHLVIDLGRWWMEQTGLPLPLGANGVRRDLGLEAARQINRLLKESIAYGLAHRDEALAYALQFGRGLDVDKAALEEISKCSRGTPRIANRLLKRVRDYAQTMGNGRIDHGCAVKALAMEGIDAQGLDALDRKYLTTLIKQYNGGPAGAEAIAASLNEEPDTLVDMVEPFMLKIGFISRTSKGRVANPPAYAHLGLKCPRRRAGDDASLF